MHHFQSSFTGSRAWVVLQNSIQQFVIFCTANCFIQKRWGSLYPTCQPARVSGFYTNQTAKPLTIIFVCIQEILELKVEDLQMFFYQDALTDLGQAVLCALV